MKCSSREHDGLAESIAATLRAERARLDLTLAALSERTGIPVSTLHSFERGRTPRADHLALLARVFRLSLDDLLLPAATAAA